MTITAACDGHGTTLTFSGFEANIIGITGPNFSRDSIEITHMGTTVAKNFIPAELVTTGDISCEIEFDVQAVPPIANGPKQTLIIVWGSVATTKTWTWTNAAFMTEFSGGAKSGDRMTGTVTFKTTAMPVVS